ncbi:N-acetylglucosamine-1-phosphodiester alpha-N-acetylglucosaminidase-like [Physella acuta]|uniref:N-acetylglucosamine-1-phosphodiester alpha-N-acetylglucosaminidase-like n=1 Tax=Physella acuta TaxID=109671 RepID=UPI0027DB7156|nr:N-acetylglucosamine-1-phosphodiester alpha-N-acetylglucosaminidase-like [Physella acuta]
MGQQLKVVQHHGTLMSWSIGRYQLLVFGLLWVIVRLANCDIKLSSSEIGDKLDLLEPYLSHHGPVNRRHRDTRECQSVKYKNVTHSKYPAQSHSPPLLPLVEAKYLIKEVGTNYWDKHQTVIHQQIVNNPMTTWSVLEPGHPGSCQNGTGARYTVRQTAEQKPCLAAANGGFFSTSTGQCLGNIVSDGLLIQDSGGVQNVHFGLTRDGYIYTGYLSELDLLTQDFVQLVGGVIWLVRDGVSYVEESKQIECPDTEETGTMERFVSVISARTAVGHDKQGRIHMVQVNGKTDQYGINLPDLAKLLIDFGLVNAINLDGGGSATTVINGTLVNSPSDQCANSSYNCERAVSSIICVHEPACLVADCSSHGVCQMGVCQCQGHWAGPDCSSLSCENGCSSHGTCSEGGCQCEAGWSGTDCSLGCPVGFYGFNCSLPCTCENGATCNPVTGSCRCPAGYTGKFCHQVCPWGYFGEDCSHICFCEHGCYCDHVTGDCNTTLPEEYMQAGKCVAGHQIQRLHLVPDKEQQYSLCIGSVICLSVITTFSLAVNALLTYYTMRMRLQHRVALKHKVRLAIKRTMAQVKSYNHNTENDDEDEEFLPSHRAMEEEEEELTGSGEEEHDSFLTPSKRAASR